MQVIAIDPGNTESAWALIDRHRWPVAVGKESNEALRLALPELTSGVNHFAIEMVASYGMAVGADVFETCVWIGRFVECIRLTHDAPPQPILVYRRDIKLHYCGSTRAKDANITQALIDRFASGEPNRGKGTKNSPGWFHGFHSDIWQAYALAVYLADTLEPLEAAS